MYISKHHVLGVIVSLLLCIVSIIPAAAQDFGMTLPEPTGSPVGYRLYVAVDESRQEIFTNVADDVRTFPLAIYYPAAPAADAMPAPYTTEAESTAYESALMIPAVVFNSIEGHLYLDAPLASNPSAYPILLFSPGFGSPIRFYTTLLTELASQGYIVAVVDHPYSQAVSLFPDETVVTANTAGSNMITGEARDAILTVWIEDMQYALDYLGELNETDPVLAGALDLDVVGAFGHSFGGAASANLSLVDDRVAASINMDGSVFGDAGQGVSKPFMTMLSGYVEFTDAQLAVVGLTREAFDAEVAKHLNSIDTALSTSESPYNLVIDGTLHATYTIDVALLRNIMPEVITPELVGAIDGARANEIFAAYTIAFFDTYLLGGPSPLLDGASPDYPEVEFLPVE
jgi:pimeloyl-ACP methyl ester carboxylesterase